MTALGRILAAWAMASAAVGLGGCDRSAPRGVLLVTIDTCRADRLGCYGAARPATPALDGLAERGTLFEQVMAPAPLTLPSHATILTGLYPDRHTVRDNGAARLPESADTVAEILADRGWSTAAFVSAFPVAREFGLDQGFHLYDDELSGSSAGNDLGETADDVAGRLFYDERRADEVADRAAGWLAEAASGSEPFLAWVHFFDPHAVYRAPARFARQYGPDSYDGEVAFVDEQIGRLLEAVEGMQDRVTVLVTADHGESLGQHEELTHGLFVYESSLRVPWILAGPEVPAAHRVPDPVSLVDVAPTLLEFLGETVPEGLDGESLVALVHGESDGPPVQFGESLFPRIHYDWAGLRAVRRGNWKLVRAPVPELYDLASDPHETTNVAASYPDIVSELTAESDAHLARGNALPVEELPVDDETIERLERLGYVGDVGADRSQVERDLWNEGGRDPKEMVGFFNKLQEIPTIMMSGRYEEAERLLRGLHEQDPDNANVLTKLALLRRLEEKWEEAAAWCHEILSRDPDDTRTRMNLAHAMLELDRREEAKEAYREVLAREPRHEDAWVRLAAAHADDGEHGEAEIAFERALSVNAQDVDILASYAVMLEDAGEPARAIARFDEALRIDPAHAPSVNGKALVYSHTDRPREAVAVLEAALPALEKDVDTLNNLAWILTNERIDPTRGLEVARRARDLAPDDAAVLDTFGWSAIRAGRPAEAVEPLRKAWSLTGDAEVRAHLGVALAESGREEEGRAHVREAVRDRPSLADVPEAARWNRP